MTETEWLMASSPFDMLDGVESRSSDRRARLVGCAAARRLWRFLSPIQQRCVEVNERYADGEVGVNEVNTACRAVHADYPDERAGDTAYNLAGQAIEFVSYAPETAASVALEKMAGAFAEDRFDGTTPWHIIERHETVYQVGLIRCVFGNPFRPVAVEPGWRTSAVVDLATGIYDDRAWDRLPVLADALEDAGCAHADVLAHLRGPGPHARGCWVVDLILGKS